MKKINPQNTSERFLYPLDIQSRDEMFYENRLLLFVFAKLPYHHTENFQPTFGADDRICFV